MTSVASSANELHVAIVGMSCRVPGANDVSEFWENLRSGLESIHSTSDGISEWKRGSLSQTHNKSFVSAAANLPSTDEFDAAFFGISTQEAKLMDPQHRLFLEESCRALEHAGYDSQQFEGQIGVFASAGMSNYYAQHVVPHIDLRRPTDAYLAMIGNDKDYLATRVSYQLDLRGPSINVQTACSSSLVATHLATQSLLNGECDMALAGGVSIPLWLRDGYFYQEGMIASPDGHCRAFDADAAGTVFGSGLGIVVLKRLAEAIADRDTIHAVIKGSAVNNDGASKVGYTAPSIGGQVAAISEALAVADVDATSISYVETHGTGTKIGDPIEIRALTEAFATDRRGFCAVGSVKTNIGHLDAASGIVGLIKTVLALSHKQLPPSLNFRSPNPEIDFDNSPFLVNDRLRNWEKHDAPLRAGVSSFGIGGTNAHVILEEAQNPNWSASPSRPLKILMLSAKSESALSAMTNGLLNFLANATDVDLADVAYTLQVGRRAFRFRRVIALRHKDELQALSEDAFRNSSYVDVSTVDDSLAAQGENAQDEFVRKVAGLWLDGDHVDWKEYYAGEARRRVPLPTYRFDSERYWIDQKQGEVHEDLYNIHWCKQQIFDADSQRGILTANIHDKSGLRVNKYAHCDENGFEDTWVDCVNRNSSIASDTQKVPKAPDHAGAWLVFADQSGIGQQLSDHLNALGETCCLVHAADQYHEMNGAVEIISHDASSFNQLVDHVFSTYGKIRGVIHLWSLDVKLLEQRSATEIFQQAFRLGCGSVLKLLQAITMKSVSLPADIWLVTEAAAAFTRRAGNASKFEVAQSPLWGMSRVIQLEFPEISGGVIDLDHGFSPSKAATLVLEEVAAQTDEEQVVYHKGDRYVPRLVAHSELSRPPYRFDLKKSYLITGGLGVAGLQIARWMVTQGARHLVLTGRRELSDLRPEVRVELDELQAMGAKVEAVSADVCEYDRMSRILRQIDRGPFPLAGIIHAAGICTARLLKDMPCDEFEEVLAPKTIGAWNLHQLSKDKDLEFFACFSSAGSVWGAKEQGHYDAANYFLDSLVHYRQSLGLPGLSINWGVLATGGICSEKYKDFLQGMGMKKITSDRAHELFGYLLGTGATQIVAAQIDRDRFVQVHSARRSRPLFNRLRSETDSRKDAPLSEEVANVVQSLVDLPAAQRLSALGAYVESIVNDTLGLVTDVRGNEHKGFSDLGMDSILAISMRTKLQQSLCCELPATVAFDYPNVKSMTEYIAQHVFRWPYLREPYAQPGIKPDSPMSESEIRMAIEEEIKEIEGKLHDD